MKDNRPTQKKGWKLTSLLSSISFLVTEDVDTRDKRRSPRLVCRCAIAYVDENGNRGSGFLVDVSRRGLQIETPVKVSKGLTLAIKAPEIESLDKTAPFMAKVRWTKKGEDGKYHAGLALPPGVEDDPNWLESLLEQLGYQDSEDQRRQFIRADSRLNAVLVLDEGDGNEHSVTVENLGMGGALINSAVAFPKDAQFHVTLGPVEDLPQVGLEGTILRVVEQPAEECYLHPSRFRPTEERDEKVLREYVLKFSEKG